MKIKRRLTLGFEKNETVRINRRVRVRSHRERPDDELPEGDDAPEIRPAAIPGVEGGSDEKSE